MKALVFGSGGFLGRHTSPALQQQFEVFTASRKGESGKYQFNVDMSNSISVGRAIADLLPDVIVNCAGITANNDEAKQNLLFTQNILHGITDAKYKPSRVVILGSAGEYGILNKNELPVKEDTRRRATSLYGLSKIAEVDYATSYAAQHNIPLTIARIFNPIGSGMPQRLLLPGLVRQIDEIKQNKRDTIEVNRLDSERDYVDVRDVAAAIFEIVSGEPKHDVYNIGSGKGVTTQELIDMIMRHSILPDSPNVIELQDDPEPTVASCADISRMKEDFEWQPIYGIDEVIKELMINE